LRGPYDLNRETVLRLVEAIRGLRRKKLAVDELLKDFGPKSDMAVNMVNVLYGKVVGSKSLKVEALFNDWKRLFSQVCAYSPEKLKGLEAEYGLTGKVDYSALLFAVHTYYALVMKLLAAEVAYLFGASRWLKSYVAELEDANMKGLDAFKRALEDLESGGVFRKFLNITNFIEGDYFSWYLEELDQETANKIADLAKRLADYEPATPVLEPEYTRDLLKRLYQNLVPRDIRKKTGEFYTPDWLAELLLNEVGLTIENFEKVAKDGDLTKPLDLRILDPACGSGTFLVLTMKRFREYAEEHYLKDVLINYLLRNVVGFDLNPLAVLASRTNYLLAVADLLTYAKGPIEIPVYLADSLLVEAKTTLTGISYITRTYVGTFELPKSLVDRGVLGKLLESLDRYVRLQYRIEDFKRVVREELKMTEEELRLASTLYATFLKLEQEGKNHVWTAIIRNAFAPITIIASHGKFDYVIGNPPWVNWENLPEDYRNASAKLWEKYGLKAKSTAEQFELGKMKRDISMLFLYVCADRFLENHGMFGFLITQMVFKTKGAEVFRRFRLPEGIGIKVLKVHDMVTLKPFEGAANMTSMIILRKGEYTSYPVPYIRWVKLRAGELTTVTLNEAYQLCSQDELIAVPVDAKNITSSWLTVKPSAINALNKIRGVSPYKAYEGVHPAGANGVYWIKIIGKKSNRIVIAENLPEMGKKRLQKITEAIESDLVYPLIRSGDIKRWNAKHVYYTLVPHTRKTGWQAIDESSMKVNFPKTYGFLLQFRNFLLERPAYKLLRKGHPFYIMIDVHKESFASFKVTWKQIGSKIDAAVLGSFDDAHVGKKVLIPQWTLAFIPTENEDEAHYLCAMINSTPVEALVKLFSQLGGKGFAPPSIIDKVKIPQYDSRNEIQKKLVEMSKKAHKFASENNTHELSKIEEEIDSAAAKLYDLTEDEQKEIKNALKLLKGEEVEEEVVEEPVETKVDFLNAVASPNVAGSFEVAITNPPKNTVEIELQLPDRKVKLETDKEQETIKVKTPPLPAGEHKIPYKIIAQDKVAKGEFTLHVKEKKRFRKEESLTGKLDELLEES
jgi:hypothetical protein